MTIRGGRSGLGLSPAGLAWKLSAQVLDAPFECRHAEAEGAKARVIWTPCDSACSAMCHRSPCSPREPSYANGAPLPFSLTCCRKDRNAPSKSTRSTAPKTIVNKAPGLEESHV